MKNLKRNLIVLTTFLAVSAIALIGFWQFSDYRQSDPAHAPEEQELTRAEMKAGRAEYFFKLMRDPATNSIPANIRSRELNYAKKMQQATRFKSAAAPSQYVWDVAGPNDLGGRTRALGIDQRNKDIVITGGVSGGIWKSIDGGSTWTMKSDLLQNMSVTSLAQDPGNPDTWYYTSGEFSGNSAGARGGSPRASYFGTGIYTSTDNGETWSVIPSTEDTDGSFSSRFDFISRIKVSPTTGSVFAASNGFGLLRSTDGGATFPVLRGSANEYAWTDFDIDDSGNIIAVFSSEYLGQSLINNDPGVFYSSNDGDSWTEVTPAGFPSNHDRSVIAFAPSDPTIAYVFTEKIGDSSNQGVAFFKLDITDPNSPITTDRSANIPDFGGSVGGTNLQGGYNMVVAVKPDDPDFVVIGGTNLFRSTDGFATAPIDNSTTQKNKFWIGGYAKANNVSQYAEHHPDQHVVAFDPTDSNRMWSGHDGALSVTDNVTASSVLWDDRDDGLITSQFYTAAIHPDEDDERFMGGTQDNGTPFYRVNSSGQQTTSIVDVSSGDGSYAHFGNTYGYVSSQRGSMFRIKYNQSGDLTSPFDGGTSTEWASVTPSDASGQLFIHPFEVDPDDDSIMYYPATNSSNGQNSIFRNTTLDQVPNFTQSNPPGWESFEAVQDAGFVISTLEVSRSDVLYYAASYTATSKSPQLFKVEDASTTAIGDITPIDISISSADQGAYVHDIAVNPVNSNELIAVMSNYSITGIYHSSDGGSSWTAIEGSLTGTGGSDPGPSIRSAAIIPGSSATIYLVGTSTGLYSTEALSGGSTQWTQEGGASIGFGVVERLAGRTVDGDIAVGTHGLGMYRGTFQGTVGSPGPPAIPANVVADSDGGQVTLNWDDNLDLDPDSYNVFKGTSPDNLTLVQTITDGSSSYSDADAATVPLYYRVSATDTEGKESDRSELAAAFRGDKSLVADWQLAGSPLNNNNELGLPTDAQIVGFNGAYQVASGFSPGQGYWIKPTASGNIDYNTSTAGGQVTSTITLNQGWNLIGGVSDTVDVADIKDPGGILTSPVNVQGYDGASYTTASNIEPTAGYFIFANQSGDITLEVDTTSGSPKLAETSQPSFDQLYFNKDGARQSILISTGSTSGIARQAYLMPPMAPNPILDVRTVSGHRLAEGATSLLQLTADSYPVQVQLSSDATEGYRLIGTGEGEEVFFELQPGESATLAKAYNGLQLQPLSGARQVLTNGISPNYPNPFNPSTTIKYQIADQAKVSLEVYNILGKKVRTLVNQVRQPGVYTQRFDASNLSSGTYFVRITAGSFTGIQKMTLIK